MQFLRETAVLGDAMSVDSAGTHGLAGWLLERLRVWKGQRVAPQKQLRLLDSLQLGGKRQLMLVSCGEDFFLVGGGVDSIGTIVRVTSDASQGSVNSADEPCR